MDVIRALHAMNFEEGNYYSYEFSEALVEDVGCLMYFMYHFYMSRR